MRTIPDWTIQTSWWLSGIFATGAVWYFLAMNNFVLVGVSAAVAVALAGIAIFLHRKKDAEQRITERLTQYAESKNIAQRNDASPEHGAAALPGRHLCNVNAIEPNGPAIRKAILSRLPDATNVQVIPTATINFGAGPGATQKFQCQVSFSSSRPVGREEFSSVVGLLIVDLNSYRVSSDA